MSGPFRICLVTAGLVLVLTGFGGAPDVRAARPSSQVWERPLARVDSLLAVGETLAGRDLARDLSRRSEADPQYHWQFRARLGLALLRLDAAVEAVPHLEFAVRSAPDNATNHHNLAAALAVLGRRGRALTEYETAVSLDPGNAALRLDYGQVLLEFRNYPDALTQLETARHLCGGCPATRGPLAQVYLGRGEPAKAVPLLADLYAETPTRPVRRTLVQALQASGDDVGLIDLLAPLPPVGLDADEYLALLNAEFATGRLDRALDLVSVMVADGAAALEIPAALKTQADFWGTLSYNLLLAEHLMPGLQAADRAVSLAPDNVVFRNNRAVLLDKLGRHDDARRELETLEALKGP